MLRSLLVTVAVAVLAQPARAQLDAELKQPYLWRVVLSAKAHPLVTPDVRERLKRDTVAALQTGIGAFGTVEFIDLADLPADKEALFQQFIEKGFPALDAPRDLTGAKTHFLKLEYRDGQFHLEARQYDGFTGLSSPLVRAQSVRGADQVGRAAGLLIERDFGLAGTVEPLPKTTDLVKVQIRGAALGNVSTQVAVGDVFAVAAVRKTNRPAPPPVRTATGKIVAPPPGSVPPPGLTSTPRDFTLLKVIEVGADGTLSCTVLSRYEKPMPLVGGIIGYRCMKLGTVKAPVAIQLKNTDGAIHKTASAVSVRATDTDFTPVPDAAKDVCGFDTASAQFRSQRPLNNLACVTVALGATQAKQFPVPILSAAPIVLPFEIDPTKEERAAFERAVLAAYTQSNDARAAQNVCFDAVAKAIEKQRNPEALARAQGGYNAAEANEKQLTDELARLTEQAGRVQKADGIDALLAKIKQNVDTVRAYNEQLKKSADQIALIVKRESDPNFAAKEAQAQAVNTRFELLLSSHEYDQAIAALEQLVVLLPENADVKARRDKLVAEWKPKDDAHTKARDYLLRTWPAVATIPDFKDSLTQIRSNVDVCKKNGDKLALRKLLVIFGTTGGKLSELVGALDQSSEADKKLLADANAVGKALAALEIELLQFVN
jgi:tetratricopeptide (TPR) repeat protein